MLPTKESMLLALFVAFTATSAPAADNLNPAVIPENRPSDPGQWSFAASPYFWAAGMSGNVGQFNLPVVKVKSDFSEILSDLDFAFMGTAEARKDRISIFSDVIYTKISTASGTPQGVLATSVDLKSETFAGLLGLGYTAYQDSASSLDLVAGVRIWHANTKLSFNGGFLDGVSRTDGATWVDAMAGIRGKFALTSNIYLSGWGLAGAGQADLDWDAAAIIGYQVSDRVSAVAGYRALGVDYREDNFVFDVVQQGPILGMVVRF
ncbi:hypothetical protein R2G56_01015 [Nitratireductor aquimarinus]|uniref:Outer membrane protein beta-barrel domain-containing protein n=1 Tax=Nitratireductor aquimarinus TaxID=889300 RepID=A0ABU4AF31_9HYPH|nr:hypothetical protein [Nitratireductor aquimarinus]MDV6224853.1 hypothetical protein [Nitratireductor aquimarinus]